jgi:hypothetical protein
MAVQTVSSLIWGPSASIPQASIEQPVPMLAPQVPPAPVTNTSWGDIFCSINQAVTNNPMWAALGIVLGYFLIKNEDKPKPTAAQTRATTRRTR